MALILTDDQNYKDIAAAIREKNGSTTTYAPGEMAAAISGGGSSNFPDSIYSIYGSENGRYYNLVGSRDEPFRGYFYGGRLSYLKLKTSTNIDFVLGCGDHGDGLVITYGDKVCVGEGGGTGVNYLELGTNPIYITGIDVGVPNHNSEVVTPQGEPDPNKLAIYKGNVVADVIKKLPVMFSKTSTQG